MTSCLRICLSGSNLNLECGATFEILRKANKATKKAALKSSGSSSMLQALDIAANVERSKMPLGVEGSVELIEMLLR